ncbi:MAG: hypothetical protein HY721_02865 [Planctomycetes bacterium]|nr:hypothetical protein [Planctomycetota bacterium]
MRGRDFGLESQRCREISSRPILRLRCRLRGRCAGASVTLLAALLASPVQAEETEDQEHSGAGLHPGAAAAIQRLLAERAGLGSPLALDSLRLERTLQTIEELTTAALGRLAGGEPPADELDLLAAERHNLVAAGDQVRARLDELAARLARAGAGREKLAAVQRTRFRSQANLGGVRRLLEVLPGQAASPGLPYLLKRLQRAARVCLGPAQTGTPRVSRGLQRLPERRGDPVVRLQAPRPLDLRRVGALRPELLAEAAAGAAARPLEDERAGGGGGAMGGGGAAPVRADDITPDIETLAARLGQDPLRIYLHVRNGFRLEVYAGSLKGAQATLETGAGNDYDLSSLLVALLRASGLTARYARGTALIPAREVTEWLGLEDPAAANVILNSAGIQATAVLERAGGPIHHYRIERVWVEVQVPSGRTGRVWVPVDPAFKRHVIMPGIPGMLGTVPFDETDYLSRPWAELTYERYQEQVRRYLTTRFPATSIADVPLSAQAIPESLSALPRSLPFEVLGPVSTFSAITGDMAHRVSVTLRHGTTALFTSPLYIPEVSLERITLSYAPRPSDQATVDGLGGLANVPAGLVSVIPRLKLAGAVAAEGPAVPYLDPVLLELEFHRPGNQPDGIARHDLKAGEWAAMGLEAFQVSDALLRRQAEAIVAATALQDAGGAPDPDDLIGAFLYLSILQHHRRVRIGEDVLSGLAHFQTVRYVYEGIAKANQEVHPVGGVPFTTLPGELVVDVPRQILGQFSLDDDNTYQRALWRMTGFNGSAQEHATWEELTNVASMSTIKSFQLARERGIPILVITSANGDQLIPQLNHSEALKDKIRAEVGAGKTVTIPRDPTPLDDWQGVGYFVDDAANWSMAFIIDGRVIPGSGGGGSPDEAHGGALPVEIEDGKTYWFPPGNTGDDPGSSYTGDPVNIANGNLFHEETDFAIPALGEPLAFRRHYNSTNTFEGPLGRGWTHNYGDALLVDQDDGKLKWVTSEGAVYVFEEDPATPGSYLFLRGPRQQLTRMQDGHRLRRFDGRTQDFDASGRLVARSDRNGNTTLLTYDGAGRLASLTDPAGRSLTFGYHASGRLATVTDFTGRVWTFAYDSKDRLIRAEGPSDAATRAVVARYEYHETAFLDGLLRRYVRPGGGAHEYRYYANGRVYGTIDPLGNVMTFVYNPFKKETRVTDERGITNVHGFNDSGNQISVTYADGTLEQWTWEDDRITSHTDGLGHTELFEYDPEGNLRRTVDPTSLVTRYEYDPPYSNVVRITRPGVPEERITSFRYDPRGNLAEVTDAEGGIRAMVNDARGLAVAVTDPRGAVVTMEYNDAGQLTRRTTELPSTEWIEYGPRGTVIRRTDANDHTTTYEYDLLDRQVSLTDAEGYTARQVYDDAGRLIESIDARGLSTRYGYDLNDRLIRRIYPDGSEVSFTYDGVGNLIEETDELGRVSRYVYDVRNRRTEVHRPDGSAVLTAPDAAGRIASTTDPRGNTTRYEYDAAGRKTAEIDALGNRKTWAHDENGNPEILRDRRGGSTSFEYDKLDRVTVIRGEGGLVESIDYDPNGNVVARARYDISGLAETPPDPRTLPVERQRVQRYEYDVLNRLTQRTDPEGAVIRYEYDKTKNAVAVADERSNVTRYGYDRIDQLVRVLNPDGGETLVRYDEVGNRTGLRTPRGGWYAWEYDARNRIVASVDPLGKRTTFTYDLAGNKTAQVNPDGTWTRRSYDPLNRLRHLERSDGTFLDRLFDRAGNLLRARTERTLLWFTYDALNRRTSETLVFTGTSFVKSVAHAYDAEGDLLSVTDPTGRTVAWSYDLAARLTGVTDSGSPTATITYNGHGEREVVAYGNGLAGLHVHDGNGRPALIDWTAAVARLAYDRDGAGNPTLIDESIGGTPESLTTTYDELNRPGAVLAATDPASRAETFSYDLSGNLLDAGDGAQATYDAADQLMTKGDAVYTHDPRGNRVLAATSTAWTVTPHDPSNRMTALLEYDRGELQKSTSLTYDGLDRLVEVRTGTSVRRIVYTLQNRLTEFDESGNVAVSYTMGPGLDDAFATKAQGGVRYLHRDAIGSVRAVTDAAGQLLGSFHYGQFGRLVRKDGSPDVPLGYAARPFDEGTDLVDMRARFLDPGTARFLARDPLELLPTAPNPYAYAANRPHVLIDPLGLSPSSPWKDVLHSVLDLGGLIPGFGEPLDVIHGFIYLAEGDRLNAGLSFAAAIPVGGWAATAAKGVNRAADAVRAPKVATKLLNPPIKVTREGMQHVLDRHTVNDIAKYAGKSKFNAGEDIASLIDLGTQQPMVRQVNGNYARTFSVGREIGADRATGNATSIMTVITRPDGTLVTAFPGKP